MTKPLVKDPAVDPVNPQPAPQKQPNPFNFELLLTSVGRLFALAYGALCGMGINARVLAAFDSSALAYAIGSVTFFVNVALFWTIVPAMLVKLFVNQDLFEESFKLKNKKDQDNEKYAKIKHNGLIEKLKFWPWEAGFSVRAWFVLSFALFFGLCAGLAYTGLLMMTLPTTLATLGLTNFLPLSVMMGFFFSVSAVCNWFFNSYDAAEQFSKNDFFSNLFTKHLPELLGLKPNPSLLIGEETLQNVNPWAMRARQLLRFVIFSGIVYLGAYAVYAVAHMGTLGLFSYLMPGSITGADGVVSIAKYGSSLIQGLKWTMILGGITGGSFLFGVQISRFSSLATKILTNMTNHYVSFADNAPTLAHKIVTLTLFSPFIAAYMIGEGLYAALVAEKDYLVKAFNQTAAYYQEARGGEVLACIPLFFYHFINNNMHALAVINASAQGLLAVKPGEPLVESMEAVAGSASASIMCYGNKLNHDAEIAAGRATNKQDIAQANTLFFRHRGRDPQHETFAKLDGTTTDFESLDEDAFYLEDPIAYEKQRFQMR